MAQVLSLHFLDMADELVSIVEVAEMLGVSRQRVHQLLRAYDDFPAPTAELAVVRIWRRSDVIAWISSHPRRTGRPSKTATHSPGANRPPGGAGGSQGGRRRRAT